MRERLIRLLVGIGAVLGVGLVVGAAPVRADAAGEGYAYVWAHTANATLNTPYEPTGYNASSFWPSTRNSVTRTGTGAYTVQFKVEKRTGGVVHVASYGGGSERCKVYNWAPTEIGGGLGVLARVRCFTASGSPANAQFVASYTNKTSFAEAPSAYLWADQPSAASYTPAVGYQANSRGGAGTIIRGGTGLYEVTLPRHGEGGGHVQVTAYGGGSAYCKVTNWVPSAGGQKINVRCFTTAGAFTDSMFTLTYVYQGNILNARNCCGPGPSPVGHPAAYAWADQPSRPSYQASPAYSWNYASGANAVTNITRAATGDYAVRFNANGGQISLADGNVAVTGYGTGSATCKVVGWATSTGVRVRCFSPAGAAADSQFTVAYLGKNVNG
ncbi:hypothetical protein GCM10027589_23890 [Actinocorallia lasiicapitis]